MEGSEVRTKLKGGRWLRTLADEGLDKSIVGSTAVLSANGKGLAYGHGGNNSVKKERGNLAERNERSAVVI